jgi:hypothetical protein
LYSPGGTAKPQMSERSAGGNARFDHNSISKARIPRYPSDDCIVRQKAQIARY